jgi:hypothetical protein
VDVGIDRCAGGDFDIVLDHRAGIDIGARRDAGRGAA